MTAADPGREDGFTLAELLISVSLFAIVFAAVFALTSASFRSNANLVAGSLVHGDARRLESALFKAAGSATYIELPSSGTLSVSELCLWENVSPDDGVSPLTAGTRSFSYFCRTGAGQVFLHQGSFPRPAIVCGSPFAGVDLTPVVGGGSAQVSAGLMFQRPVKESNIVLVDYRLDLPERPGVRKADAHGSLQLNIQGAVEPP